MSTVLSGGAALFAWIMDDPTTQLGIGNASHLRGPGHGDGFVRPHDLEVTLEPNGSTREVMIDRVVHLGFNVRVDLVDGDGARLSVQTTRDQAELLELVAGQIIYVRPTRHTTFT